RGLPTSRKGPTLTELDGQPVAIEPLSTGVVTPNEWYLVVSAPTDSGSGVGLSLPTLLVLLGGIIVLGLAIASMIAYERRLRARATTDALTGLPNRTLFADRVTQALHRAERERDTLAVLLLDLNRFKEVNDTLGHHRGDQLLVELATRLASTIRTSDTVARIGGDEFAVLLPATGVEGAIRTAERLGRALARETEVEGVPFHVEASVGIAMYPEHGETVEVLVQHADVAMYSAKRSGTDYSVYASENDPHSASRLALTAELRAGIDRGELVLHYQPKYDLATMTINSVEALVRWNHPRRGLLPPAEFVPLAEVSGLLRPLTNAVMRSAFEQVVRWAGDGWDLKVAVNISPRSLGDPTFLTDLDESLAFAGANPEQIIIEITEDSLLGEPELSGATLPMLRDRGFSVSIDDFGTGYSSMSYLRDLAVDEVKIDRSFIMRLFDDPSNQAIVQSAISLARDLGYDVVAEGIEDRQTLDLLMSMGCVTGQGFLLCRPNEPGEIEALRPASATR
ncbi:MAG: EAL domain-containing protein, partial [Thermoleophilia bacterium]|nr:EAL domain-containing protein [Thermoleophilia bacterium]